MPDIMITSDRLILRRFTHDDIPDILDVVTDPSVARETPEIPHDEEKLVGYVDGQNALAAFETKKCFDLAIERRSDGRVIGLVSLVNDGHRQAEIGWALGIDHRRQGYATEAASALVASAIERHDFHRVSASTTFDNDPSWRVMERIGMRKEAHLRQAAPPAKAGGPWHDRVIYAILAEEWRTRSSD